MTKEKTRRPYDLDRITRMVLNALIIGAIIALIDYLSAVLLPFLVACVMAYMMDPVVEFYRRVLKLKGRFLATMLTFVGLIAVLVLGWILIVPSLMNELETLLAVLQKYSTDSVYSEYFSEDLQAYVAQYIDFEYLSTIFTQAQWISIFHEAMNRMWQVIDFTAGVAASIFSWFVVLLYFIFLLLDYDKIKRGFVTSIPGKYNLKVRRIFDDVQSCMHRYFRGQALVSLIVGILFAIGFSIIGLPLAVGMGIFIGLLNLVPYLQLISIPLTGFLCLVASIESEATFWQMAGGSTIVYLVVQGIQDLILTPKIMGKYMGLNPAIILLALSVWGTLLGFVGLIIALPLTTLLMSYYKQYVLHLPAENFAKNKKQKNDETKIVETETPAET